MTKNVDVVVSLEHPAEMTRATEKVLSALVAVADKNQIIASTESPDPLSMLSARVAITAPAQEILQEMGDKYGDDACANLREQLDHLFDFTLLVKVEGEKHYIKLVVNYIVKDIGIYCFTFHVNLAKVLLGYDVLIED